jgi:hypothetical protein
MTTEGSRINVGRVRDALERACIPVVKFINDFYDLLDFASSTTGAITPSELGLTDQLMVALVKELGKDEVKEMGFEIVINILMHCG